MRALLREGGEGEGPGGGGWVMGMRAIYAQFTRNTRNTRCIRNVGIIIPFILSQHFDFV